MPKRREDKELSKYSKYKARVDLTKNRTSSEHARVACSLAGVPLGGCTRSRPLACTCVGFACVFGRRESRVVTVVTGYPHVFRHVLELCMHDSTCK